MDVMDLLKNAPGLLEAVQSVGMPEDKVSEFGSLLAQQIGGSDGLDFSDLLGGLDRETFLAKVDVSSLSEQLGVPLDVVQKVVDKLGPFVSEFSPGEGFGGLVSKLLD